jgi:hypothetical protein
VKGRVYDVAYGFMLLILGIGHSPLRAFRGRSGMGDGAEVGGNNWIERNSYGESLVPRCPLHEGEQKYENGKCDDGRS